MSESQELAVAEQPQQLITIEPEKYVALVFEPFRKKLDALKAAAAAVTYDIATPAGMRTAIEWRAKFRDEVRLQTEVARKERKAPILEIGRLLDSRAKAIAEEVEPYETRFDSDIKAEEQRKEAIKAEAARVEAARQAKIQTAIDAIKAVVLSVAGKSSAEIDRAQVALDFREITAEEFDKRAGEAMKAKADTLARLGEMHAEAETREQEAARAAAQAEADRIERERIAAEQRAESERLAALAREIEEQERRAAVARAQQERKDREAREAEETRLRAEREAHEAKLRAEREAEETRLRAERQAEEQRLSEQRAELARQQATIDAANAERERVEREVRERAEAEERRQREESEAAARAEAQRIADEQAAEARRVQAEKDAAEAERLRRERVQFELNGPGDVAIVELLATHYGVSNGDVVGWLERFDAESFDDKIQQQKAA